MYISEHRLCSEMNYKHIHDTHITYIRSTPTRDRLLKRNPTDSRLAAASLYIEMHHIIPRSLGGLDDSSNLVEVLPEEHIFLHMLRYKIYGKREDALAVRFMLNGYDAKPLLSGTKIALTKQIRMGYAWIRTHAQTIREKHGWHTPEGVANISKARRGKMPAKDALTGKKIGMVEITHPKVLSGEWVHHTKGRQFSAKEIEQIKTRSKGQSNGNASGLPDEYFIQKGLEAFKEFGFILSWGEMLKLSKVRGFRWIKSLRSRFDGKDRAGYYMILEEQTKVKFNPYRSRTESVKN